MTRSFTLSDAARGDVAAIGDYLATYSHDAAVRFYDAAWRTMEGLVEMPGKGRARRTEAQDLLVVRSWSVEGFPSLLTFYRPTESGIHVLRVMHGARDLGPELGI